MSSRCAGTSRAGNPCGRTPGPDGFCPAHTPGQATVPTAERATDQTAREAIPANPGPDPADEQVHDWSASDHAHTYGPNDICTVPGCDRLRPAWLTTATASATAAPQAGGRLGGLLNPTGPWRRTVFAAAALIVLMTLLSGVGHAVSARVAQPVTTGFQHP